MRIKKAVMSASAIGLPQSQEKEEKQGFTSSRNLFMENENKEMALEKEMEMKRWREEMAWEEQKRKEEREAEEKRRREEREANDRRRREDQEHQIRMMSMLLQLQNPGSHASTVPVQVATSSHKRIFQ